MVAVKNITTPLGAGATNSCCKKFSMIITLYEFRPIHFSSNKFRKVGEAHFCVVILFLSLLSDSVTFAFTPTRTLEIGLRLACQFGRQMCSTSSNNNICFHCRTIHWKQKSVRLAFMKSPGLLLRSGRGIGWYGVTVTRHHVETRITLPPIWSWCERQTAVE
jgi:hypothetical protein